MGYTPLPEAHGGMHMDSKTYLERLARLPEDRSVAYCVMELKQLVASVYISATMLDKLREQAEAEHIDPAALHLLTDAIDRKSVV